jgi:hypothetical protein
MNRPTPVFARDARLQAVRRPASGADMTMYQAILGKAPVIEENAAPKKKTALARRQQPPAKSWSPLVLSNRLREMCRERFAVRPLGQRRPDVADWLRYVSDEAIRRLEQAHARISSSRPRANRRKTVQSREVASKQNVLP